MRTLAPCILSLYSNVVFRQVSQGVRDFPGSADAVRAHHARELRPGRLNRARPEATVMPIGLDPPRSLKRLLPAVSVHSPLIKACRRPLVLGPYDATFRAPPSSQDLPARLLGFQVRSDVQQPLMGYLQSTCPRGRDTARPVRPGSIMQ